MRLLLLLLIFLCPQIVSADTAFSFTPPISDLSVVFLADIFGVVDGVLNGTGSQIMGAMFSILNAAVLALGGIVIIYTIIVGTVNTAQEGEMLGHKWSSVWVPVRATLGLALLLPKASGYCLIQIFVMWVVIQGVGAADQVWNSALSYLNRGGVIVQAQASLNSSSTPNVATLYTGAAYLLNAQVCMLALQNIAESMRTSNLNNINNGNVCTAGQATNTQIMQQYCSASVPNFLNTVEFVTVQELTENNYPAPSAYSVAMPNFPLSSPYSSFNGQCGTMTWNAMQTSYTQTLPTVVFTGMQSRRGVTITNSVSTQLTPSEMTTFQHTRALALQQMYEELGVVANRIVDNDPQLTPSTNPVINTGLPYTIPFGVPESANGTTCVNSSDDCTGWGSGDNDNSSGSVLFSGSEFVSAVYDYDGIMMPSLSYNQELQSGTNVASNLAFIAQAQASGWMTAGQYFINLVQVNASSNNSASATANDNLVDTQSGFPTSLQNLPSNLAAAQTNCLSQTPPPTLFCYVIDTSTLQSINNLYCGSTQVCTAAPATITQYSRNVTTGESASTINGYLNNAPMVQLPGQPGIVPVVLPITFKIAMSTSMIQLPNENLINCPKFSPLTSIKCIVSVIESALYYIIQMLINTIISWISSVISVLIQALVYVPMMMLSTIFTTGMTYLQTPGNNPIISLAVMGTTYINFMVNMWIDFFIYTILFSLIPGMLFLFLLVIPLVMSWMAIMVGIGFTTAYYVPFYPYMIFTFGVIAWLMAVIEAMVAAPIVALGITHPEGEGILGKGEQALMILMNVFLRPAMMIIGYIAAIAMCYVSVWVLNVGFQYAANFTTGSITGAAYTTTPPGSITGAATPPKVGYIGFAGLYAGFFAIVLYTSMYVTVVQKSFTLIYSLPDKVMRWIGGHPESVGQELAQWTDESKQKLKETGDETGKAGAAMSSKLQAKANAFTDRMSKDSGSKGAELTGSGG